MWSYILSIVGVTGLFFAGRGQWWAWGIAFFNEMLWIIYALTTEQYGFIFGAVAYAMVHAKNARDWKINDGYT